MKTIQLLIRSISHMNTMFLFDSKYALSMETILFIITVVACMQHVNRHGYMHGCMGGLSYDYGHGHSHSENSSGCTQYR